MLRDASRPNPSDRFSTLDTVTRCQRQHVLEETPMNTSKASVGVVGLVLIVLIGLAGVWSQSALAQADPHVGTWVLNVAKSKYSPGPPPKEQTSVFSAAGKGINVSTKGMSADGKPTMTEYTADFDGKDHPVKGNPDWDAVSLKRVDSHTIEFTRKRGGKMVQTATSVVSKDGKTRTITTTGVNAQGQKMSTVAIYEKK
jgi:hypothetical protein